MQDILFVLSRGSKNAREQMQWDQITVERVNRRREKGKGDEKKKTTEDEQNWIRT